MIDLYNFSLTNNAAFELCNNEMFWRQRYVERHGNVLAKSKPNIQTWKQYYSSTYYLIIKTGYSKRIIKCLEFDVFDKVEENIKLVSYSSDKVKLAAFKNIEFRHIGLDSYIDREDINMFLRECLFITSNGLEYIYIIKNELETHQDIQDKIKVTKQIIKEIRNIFETSAGIVCFRNAKGNILNTGYVQILRDLRYCEVFEECIEIHLTSIPYDNYNIEFVEVETGTE